MYELQYDVFRSGELFSTFLAKYEKRTYSATVCIVIHCFTERMDVQYLWNYSSQINATRNLSFFSGTMVRSKIIKSSAAKLEHPPPFLGSTVGRGAAFPLALNEEKTFFPSPSLGSLVSSLLFCPGPAMARDIVDRAWRAG